MKSERQQRLEDIVEATAFAIEYVQMRAEQAKNNVVNIVNHNLVEERTRQAKHVAKETVHRWRKRNEIDVSSVSS
jgi:hypothetical protein